MPAFFDAAMETVESGSRARASASRQKLRAVAVEILSRRWKAAYRMAAK
jgi:hypothetical protein